MMRRRALLTVGANLVCWPLVALAPASADAQQVGKVYRVGREITTSVPIVMASSRYPVEIGIVQSLARPGGNVTGLSVNPGPEIGSWTPGV